MTSEDCRKEVWEGRIPVCFILSQDELQVGGNVHPEPCFMLLSRISYFPFVYDKLEKLYARAVGASLEDKLWLSFGPTPLKWHYPVGVLYDLHSRAISLPWEVTIHFKNYPSDDILIYEGKDALEGHFKSRIKEADWLKHGAKVIQKLTPPDFAHLWQGFSQGSFDEFWSVNQKLMLNIRGEVEPFKYIPFCIYREGEKLFQRLVPSEGTTYGELILMYYRDSDISRNDVFLVHGIELPQDTPLQWISEHLCNPDNFLHIVVTPIS